MSSLEFKHRESWPQSVSIYVDVANYSDSGPVSFGLTVQDAPGNTIYEFAETLEVKGLSEAHYFGVKKALILAQEKGVQDLTIASRSESLIQELSRAVDLTSESLRGVFEDCKVLILTFKTVLLESAKDSGHQRANELAKMVFDQ